jgi:pyridoxine 5-phosphate synthase
MAATADIIRIALDVLPAMVTLVPEKREERTTEGGLRVAGKERELSKAIETFRDNNIKVSLFIDPDLQEIKAAKKTGADAVELHTGYYANAQGHAQYDELEKLRDMTIAAHKLGLKVNAGHGLNYMNVSPVAHIQNIEELNIGHSIISKAVMVGLDKAIKEMLELIK